MLFGERPHAAAIEPEPPVPHEHASDHLIHRVLLRHIVRLSSVREPPRARADDVHRPERAQSPRHVHHARSRVIQHPDVEQHPPSPLDRIRPPVRRPRPVRDDRKDDPRHHARQNRVRLKRKPLRHRPRHDRRARRREARRKERVRVRPRRRRVIRAVKLRRRHPEPVPSREPVLARAPRQPVPDRVIRHPARAQVQAVLHQHALRVPDRHAPDLEHRESDLHREHQRGAVHEEDRVHLLHVQRHLHPRHRARSFVARPRRATRGGV
mmetsp:Transcript_3205/g.12369  ORF Transcript_3205/g.12369 Transcript_3205/m.12369 type:complete len:267 (+) Transcript_3205:944-1744(+)